MAEIADGAFGIVALGLEEAAVLGIEPNAAGRDPAELVGRVAANRVGTSGSMPPSTLPPLPPIWRHSQSPRRQERAQVSCVPLTVP